MTDTNPELDELIDNLWGRALDMTSPDFSNDEDYLLAQTNYRELCKKEFKKFFSQHEQEARIDELQVQYNNRVLLIPKVGTSIYIVKANDIKQRLIELKNGTEPSNDKV